MRRNYFILQKALAKENQGSASLTKEENFSMELSNQPPRSPLPILPKERSNNIVKSWLEANNTSFENDFDESIASPNPSISTTPWQRNIGEKVKKNITERVDETFASPNPPVYSPITPRQWNVVEEERVDETIIASPDPPVYSPITPRQRNVEEEERVDETIITSPDPPVYSPITPRQRNVEEEERADETIIASPDPTVYSPITTRQLIFMNDSIIVAESEETLSPVPPMSPDTLNLFNVLNVFDDDDSVKDPDYIADLDSTDDESTSPKNILVHAMVHDNIDNRAEDLLNVGEKINNKLQHTHNDDNLTSDKLNLGTDKRSTDKDIEKNNDDIIVTENSSRTISSPNDKNQEESIQNSIGRPKKGRKRKFDEYTLAERKKRKYNNLPYQGKTKEVKSKVFKDYKCFCRKQCSIMVDTEKKKKEFEKYVSLGSYEAQLLYIVSCVQEKPKKREYTVKKNAPSKNKQRQYTRTYRISDIEVCKDMFLKTFQITPQKVTISLKKQRKGDLKDHRGEIAGGKNRTKEEDINLVCQVIDALPKYESHYRRLQNSDVLYLKPEMTIQKIYDLYLDEHKKKHGDVKSPVSFQTLSWIFRTKFNLRVKSLKKDTCNKCDTLSARLENKNISNDEKQRLLSEKENHLKSADTLRGQMNKDLERAKTDGKFECLTFDMEKTLPLPRIPTNVVFYKRQLWFYNCGIHAGSNDKGYCCVWVEGEAGRGAQEVGSCLRKFIMTHLTSGTEHLTLWSDCCGGQNRNIKMVLLMKVILDSHPTLKTITLKFLESGHTFLPNDTEFGKIESHLKHFQRLYTADDYINVIKTCKKKDPLQVIRMAGVDFVGTKTLEKNTVNRKSFCSKNKVNWLKTKQILLKKENKKSVFMRTKEDEEYEELNIEKTKQKTSMPVTEKELILLWPTGKQIPQAKLDDLKSMFHLIPNDCIDFYTSLRGNPTITDDIEGFGVEREYTDEETVIN